MTSAPGASPECPTPIDGDRLTCDESRARAGEEEDDLGDLLRLPRAPGRRLLEKGLERLRRVAGDHRRLDHAGRERVDPYARGSVLDRRLAGQPGHSAFEAV